MKVDIVCTGDYESLYLDGKLICENDYWTIRDVLEALSIDYSYNIISFQDEIYEKFLDDQGRFNTPSLFSEWGFE